MKNKTAQIWMETVLYTLIALIMIGAVLAVVKPKIQEFQDKAITEQTIEILENIDAQILSVVRGGAGNTRIVELGIKKGVLKIDGALDKIIFEIDDSQHTYSEPGKEIPIGNINVSTQKKGKLNTITLKLDYSEKYDLKFDDEDKTKTISKAPTSYKLLFSNKGQDDISGKTKIDIELIS